MRVVFFGTPAFAVPSLEALLARGDDIALVVTQPDRPRGRSRSHPTPPPVKVRAERAGIPVAQPERPRDEAFQARLAAARAHLGVVVAYGHILPRTVLETPPLGMINVHASLLPRHRGAAPIQWAIAEGDEVTGITIMRMEAGLDSGPILYRVPTPIGAGETGGRLTERLAVLGAAALRDALDRLEAGDLRAELQDDARATVAPKIGRATARIEWARPAAEVARRIRAFDPAPGAWTTLGAVQVKVFAPRVAAGQGAPGTVLHGGAGLAVAAGDGAVAIGEVQPAGRTRMPAGDWLRGHPVPPGTRLA